MSEHFVEVLPTGSEPPKAPASGPHRTAAARQRAAAAAHCCILEQHTAQLIPAACCASLRALLLRAAPHCCFSKQQRLTVAASHSSASLLLPPVALQALALARVQLLLAHPHVLGSHLPPRASSAPAPPPLPSRTNWTRLVRRPVLTGHVSSLARAPNAPPRLRATAPPRASSVRAHAPRAPRPAPRAPRWRRSPSGPASGRVPGPGQRGAWEESACKVARGGGGLGGRPPTPLPYLFPYRSPYCMPVAPRV